MTISVVIPVYNGEQYLPACLDSLQQQTRQPDEIIVVDDGSTDRTPSILAEYSLRMPTMRVIQQRNQGVSIARNIGLENSCSNYLIFLDADDFFHPRMLARMLDMAEQHALEIVICNVLEFSESNGTHRLLFNETEDQLSVTGTAWFCDRLKKQNMFHGVCMHLYRRDFLLNTKLCFVPGMRYEDVIWTTKALIKANKVGFIAEPLYYYRLHSRPKGDISQQVVSIEKVIWSSVENACTLESFANDSDTDKGAQYWIRWQLVDGGFSVFHRIDQLPLLEAQERVLKEINKRGYWKLLWRNSVNWAQKRKIIVRFIKYCVFR